VKPSPSASPRRTLATIAEARAYYQQIVHPYNVATDAANSDYTDAVPISQYRADQATHLAALKKFRTDLLAVDWPASVQPYVTAMVLTDVPAARDCIRAEMGAKSYTDVNSVGYTNQACVAWANATNADTIRSRLGLPRHG
jgi:hypothetical protein